MKFCILGSPSHPKAWNSIGSAGVAFRKARELKSGNLPSTPWTGRRGGGRQGEGEAVCLTESHVDMIPQLFSCPKNFIHSQQITKTTATEELTLETKIAIN